MTGAMLLSVQIVNKHMLPNSSQQSGKHNNVDKHANKTRGAGKELAANGSQILHVYRACTMLPSYSYMMSIQKRGK